MISPGPVHARRGRDLDRGVARLPRGRASRRSASASATSRWSRRSAGATIRGEPIHGKDAEVEHDGARLFAGLPSPLVAGRYHSLVADPDCSPTSSSVTASYGDVVMGVRHASSPPRASSFTRSRCSRPQGKRLLANFLRHQPDAQRHPHPRDRRGLLPARTSPPTTPRRCSTRSWRGAPARCRPAPS